MLVSQPTHSFALLVRNYYLLILGSRVNSNGRQSGQTDKFTVIRCVWSKIKKLVRLAASKVVISRHKKDTTHVLVDCPTNASLGSKGRAAKNNARLSKRSCGLKLPHKSTGPSFGIFNSSEFP